MIFTDRKITIRNGKSSINEPVILYRGDYEVSIKFTIMESKFRFKSGVNLVDSEKASHGQLAILAPYGGNVFSEVVKCEDGTVTFTLTKEMIDQLEEVGLYSFQIRLFDYYRESRVSIPPVEFGIEVREPVASEDHDNEVNNAIVGYSIAKVTDALNEDVPDTFDANGQYNKTDWETGDRITEGKLNKIEDAIDTINQNEKNDVAALDKRVTNNFNVLDNTKADKNEIFSMKNMGQDVKEAMTGGSVAVVGVNAILSENIVDGQVTTNKTDFMKKIVINSTSTILNDTFVNVGKLGLSNGIVNDTLTDYITSDFISIEKDTVFFRYTSNGSSPDIYSDYIYVFYDESDNVISSGQRGTSYEIEKYNDFYGAYYIPPQKAKKVKFSIPIAHSVNGSGRLYTYLKIKNTYRNFVKDLFLYDNYIKNNHINDNAITENKTIFFDNKVEEVSININNEFNIEGEDIGETGSIFDSYTIRRTDYIDITDCKIFRYVRDGNSDAIYNAYKVSYYDESKTFISQEYPKTNYTIESYDDKYGYYYNIPSRAKYIIVSIPLAHTIHGDGNLYTYLLIKDKKTYTIKNDYINSSLFEDVKPSKFKDKTFLFLGDSILGNDRDDTGICNLVSEMLDTNVINGAFGGSMMSHRSTTSSEESTKLQIQCWNSISAVGIVDALVSRDFSLMETSMTLIEGGLNYFEYACNTLKSVDMNKVDYVIFEHGTNDFTRTGLKIKNEEDENDLCSYYNAYKYCIETLLTKYPHLQLVLFTPTWRYWKDNEGNYSEDSDTRKISERKLTDFVATVKEVGIEEHIPVIDNYYNLTMNKYTISTFLKDGTHFNEEGRRKFASRVSGQLRNIL